MKVAQVVPILLPLILIVCAASPAAAISADLANKCRDIAIKAHPPPFPPGNKAYAQAERDFFGTCVSKNGQVPDVQSPSPK
jgi:hypothetical protein